MFPVPLATEQRRTRFPPSITGPLGAQISKLTLETGTPRQTKTAGEELDLRGLWNQAVTFFTLTLEVGIRAGLMQSIVSAQRKGIQ